MGVNVNELTKKAAEELIARSQKIEKETETYIFYSVSDSADQFYSLMQELFADQLSEDDLYDIEAVYREMILSSGLSSGYPPAMYTFDLIRSLTTGLSGSEYYCKILCIRNAIFFYAGITDAPYDFYTSRLEFKTDPPDFINALIDFNKDAEQCYGANHETSLFYQDVDIFGMGLEAPFVNYFEFKKLWKKWIMKDLETPKNREVMIEVMREKIGEGKSWREDIMGILEEYYPAT